MNTYRELADEAIQKFHLDPARTERALLILANHNVVMARIDEMGQDITPTRDAYAVKSPKTPSSSDVWHIVRPSRKSCTCRDHAAGNICKHRIAVYLYTELPRRQFAQAAQLQKAEK